MVGKLLVRGMLAGVVAGLVAFGFARAAGEPQIERAIAYEETLGAVHGDTHAEAHTNTRGDTHAEAHGGAHSDMHVEAHEQEIVSREIQAGVGLLTAAVVYGAAFGGLLALTFAYAYGRVGSLDARSLSAWLALAAFVSLTLVPGLKYPANPPAVGAPETIGQRTGLYFLMIAISIAVSVFSLQLRRFVAARVGQWNASVVAGIVFIAIIACVQLALPVVDEVPATFPAAVLWKFRVAAIGMQAVLWAVIGLLFGYLVERSGILDPARPRTQRQVSA